MLTLNLKMAGQKEILLGQLRNGDNLSTGQQIRLAMILAVPAILAQLSMCLMNYIDAAMVGRLGSAQAAAVGLVTSTIWIFGSFCYANSSGFSVQIAHRCGARDFEGARSIFRQGLLTVLGASVVLCALGLGISGALPRWLGGTPEIIGDAAAYFRIWVAFIPFFQLAAFCEAALIATGNVKISSIISMTMCIFDVAFNCIFIFLLEMGVKGAALGTGLALTAGAVWLLISAMRTTELKQNRHWGWLLPTMKNTGSITTARVEYKTAEAGTGEEAADVSRKATVLRALHISWPLWMQNLVVRGAYIAATVIVAPLGTIAIAANSFAIIAEGFCYLPGYGMQDAASTLVGQSLGAGRKDMARRFSFITISSGATMMTFLAVFMWIFAPQIMGLLTPDQAVIDLGAKCLRIEAWAELLFGVSIVANGCFVGAGSTLFPSVANLVSMWVIRIGLALLLIPRHGLEGYWVAMATELSVKGIVFAIRIRGNRWLHAFQQKKAQV